MMQNDRPADTYDDANEARLDRIYRLLPPVIHLTDERAGRPLQALMRVLARQADIVEDDLRGLYENWFIETCDDWVVPYLGELIGYKLVPENTPPEVEDSERGRERMRVIVPRAEVADTIRFRRRKGSLLLLEELAQATVGWPARAVEFRELIAATWHTRFPNQASKRTLNLRQHDVLREGYGPFDSATRLVDVRRLNSTQTRGRGNVFSVGLWVWRLKSLLVQEGRAGTRGSTELADHVHRFTFHSLGIDQPLFAQAQRPPEPVGPADEFSVPGPLTRRDLQDNIQWYYGPQKSLFLSYHWLDSTEDDRRRKAIPCERIEVGNLTNWEHSLPSDHPFRMRDYSSDPNDPGSANHPYVVVDPERGRMLVRPPFASDLEPSTVSEYPPDPPADPGQQRRRIHRQTHKTEFEIKVRYHYGSAAAIGGGDYPRRLPPVRAPWKLWRVSRTPLPISELVADQDFTTLAEALAAWKTLKDSGNTHRRVVIEIDDDSTFDLGLGDNRYCETEIGCTEALVIRAAPHRRPVIFAPGGEVADLTWEIFGTTSEDPLSPGGLFALQGLMVGGLNLIVADNLQRVSLQDCTLVAPELNRKDSPYANTVLQLQNLTACVSLDRSIVIGSIRVDWDEFPSVPLTIEARDSILDGAGCPLTSPALSSTDISPAFAKILLQRCTVVGSMHVTQMVLAEDTIFTGKIDVAQTNVGCLRFCSIPAETALADPALTPARYSCQPDLYLREYKETHPGESKAHAPQLMAIAKSIAPIFVTRRFGEATYLQLSETGPEQIRRGASDESEMGAFHDLYVPQRINLLRARLAEFTPAGADAELLFAT